MDKHQLLLRKGYFPVQLPPAFTTEPFSQKYKRFGPVWESKRTKSVPPNVPERFSVARSSYNRRMTSILNPVAYYFLSKSVATYWASIQRHFSGSRFSYSRPKLKSGIRAIDVNRFSDIHDHKILSAAGYRFALITDVSRFFPTIYTHSIPWALHGKAIAKAHREKTAAYYGNILDADCMAAQDFQTVGLPIGPDTSHVIAEIVGVAIDKELRQKFGHWPSGFRYVDDFCLFFNSREEAEQALSAIVKTAAAYELQINAQKTRIIETKEMIEESWKYKLKGVAVSEELSEQRDDIHKFFETLLTLEKTYRDENVVKYGLKVISLRIIKKPNWKVYEAYLLHCGFAYPNTMQVIASILATYAKHNYPLDRKAIERFCNATIRTHSRSENHSEVAWALWIMIELELRLQKEAASELGGLASSVCLLLALSVTKRSPTKIALAATSLAPHAAATALYKEHWLLAYEAGRRLWLGNPNYLYITNDRYFGELANEGVGFYDDALRLPPIFRLKDESTFNASLFESDQDIASFFDFDESDEEYFDGPSHMKEETDDGDTQADDDGQATASPPDDLSDLL